MDKQAMPHDSIGFFKGIVEHGLLNYIGILFISFWAGTAKYLSTLNGKKPTFWGWFADTVISGFVGVLAALLCQYYQIDYLLTAVITGISAHNGTRALCLMTDIIKRNVSKQV